MASDKFDGRLSTWAKVSPILVVKAKVFSIVNHARSETEVSIIKTDRVQAHRVSEVAYVYIHVISPGFDSPLCLRHSQLGIFHQRVRRSEMYRSNIVRDNSGTNPIDPILRQNRGRWAHR